MRYVNGFPFKPFWACTLIAISLQLFCCQFKVDFVTWSGIVFAPAATWLFCSQLRINFLARLRIYFVSGLLILKVLANEDTLLRTHCCRHKCFPVCPCTQHLLRTQILCPGHKKCFWFWSETFCVHNKCFPVCATCDTSWATMCPQQCVLVCQYL